VSGHVWLLPIERYQLGLERARASRRSHISILRVCRTSFRYLRSRSDSTEKAAVAVINSRRVLS
jgi:hypothetical protein